jgi:hypothetical protein
LLHGIQHILTGYDHLLFLCALVLGAASLWDLFKIVTAFTIAHSITLTLATFGLAHLPEQVVEPMIAASIVFRRGSEYPLAQAVQWQQQAGSRFFLWFVPRTWLRRGIVRITACHAGYPDMVCHFGFQPWRGSRQPVGVASTVRTHPVIEAQNEQHGNYGMDRNPAVYFRHCRHRRCLLFLYGH